MYDFFSELPDRSAKAQVKTTCIPDSSNLNTPELSFDLNSLIESDQEFFTASNPFTFSMPQSVGFGSDCYAAEAGVKQESSSEIETSVSASSIDQNTGTYAFAGLSTTLSDASVNSETCDKKSKKVLDKSSEEYRRRRERNNDAVRRSREKAAQRYKDTEKRVNELVLENDELRKRVELLSKELSVLKNLLSTVGVPPESVVKEQQRI